MILQAKWQDYRGKKEGVLIHMDTTQQHELPHRDILNENGKGAQTEPNYESGTYGVFSCVNAKTLLSAYKNKRRYLLFGTRYQGTIEELRGRFFIIGFMRLDQVMDTRKRHMHNWMENQEQGKQPECFDMEVCPAFRSEEMNFYSAKDAFELDERKMKDWGYKGKITKQMKLTFTEEKLEEVLNHFTGKTPRNEEYIRFAREIAERVQEESESAEEPKADEW